MKHQVKLSKRQYNLIKLLVSAKEESLKLSIEAVLKKYYDEKDIIVSKYYVAAKGTIPVALVAHLDTVHKYAVDELYHDTEKGVLWSPEGIGADDRAGVFSILEILGKGYRPSVIFCCKEEIGGAGAGCLILENPKPFGGIKYLIELDRQGESDSVYYRCNNPQFEQMINSYGFVTSWGSFSDISIIAPAWELCAVNLSVGYYDEHSLGETWHYRQTLQVINKVCKILEDSINDENEYPYIEGQHIWSQAIPANYSVNTSCAACGDSLVPEMTITVKELDKTYNFCPICATNLLSFCEYCNEPYLDFNKHLMSCGGLTV